MQVVRDDVSMAQWADLKSAHDGAKNIYLQGHWWLIRGIYKTVRAGGVSAAATLEETTGPY